MKKYMRVKLLLATETILARPIELKSSKNLETIGFGLFELYGLYANNHLSILHDKLVRTNHTDQILFPAISEAWKALQVFEV